MSEVSQNEKSIPNLLFNPSDRDCYEQSSGNNELYVFKAKTNALKRPFGYRGDMMWNSLTLNYSQVVHNAESRTWLILPANT